MEEREIDHFINKLAAEIVERHLAAPAVVFLESSKPLSFVGNQAMVFMNPIIHLFITVKDYDKYAKLLEDRGNIERLITAIEEREDEKIRRKKGEA